jgi:anthranilate phosphoribosyltransferase
MWPTGSHLVDIVGTGGDGSHTFNISTCSMFVAAAAGAKVSKHGGRSVSSKSGSADVMEALGINIQLTPEAHRAVHRGGRGRLHVCAQPPSGDEERGSGAQGAGYQDHLQPAGPLTNPADAPNILMGVFHPDLVGIQVRALQRLGTEHAVVVYGRDGMDEVSLGAATMVGELRNGEIAEYEIHPEDFGMVHGQQPRAQGRHAPRSRRVLLLGCAGQPARRAARHRDPQRRCCLVCGQSLPA